MKLWMFFAPFLLVVGCPAFAPEVGPLHSDAAALDSASCAPKESDYAGYDAASGGGPDPQCVASADDSPCVACEMKNCCASRLGCYADVACSCAAQALDACISGDGGAGDASNPAAQCWSAFASAGALASARIVCLRAPCQDACGAR